MPAELCLCQVHRGSYAACVQNPVKLWRNFIVRPPVGHEAPDSWGCNHLSTGLSEHLHWSQHNGLMSSLQTGLVSPQFKPCLLVDVSPLYCPSASCSSGDWKMHLPVSVNVHHPRFIPSMEFVDCFCKCKLQQSKGSLTLGV